jgi:PIN domain nuclease of toxin-antitoxin system
MAAKRPRPRLLLLDTHVWVWAVEGLVDHLRTSVVGAIEAAAQGGRLYVAAVSAWQVAMLVKKGRLVLSRDVRSWVAAARHAPGVRIAPLTVPIAIDSADLPGLATRDPADRFIAATARALSAHLVTCDGPVLEYGATGQLLTIDARP